MTPLLNLLFVSGGAFVAGQLAFWGLVLVGLRTGHLRWSGASAAHAPPKP